MTMDVDMAELSVERSNGLNVIAFDLWFVAKVEIDGLECAIPPYGLFCYLYKVKHFCFS